MWKAMGQCGAVDAVQKKGLTTALAYYVWYCGSESAQRTVPSVMLKFRITDS
jgi:hypothetical protein